MRHACAVVHVGVEREGPRGGSRDEKNQGGEAEEEVLHGMHCVEMDGADCVDILIGSLAAVLTDYEEVRVS